MPFDNLNELKKKAKRPPPIPYAVRLLRALEEIYRDPRASIADKIRAIELSLETLPHRTIPRHKTDKEKAVIRALEESAKSTIKDIKKEPEIDIDLPAGLVPSQRVEPSDE